MSEEIHENISSPDDESVEVELEQVSSTEPETVELDEPRRSGPRLIVWLLPVIVIVFLVIATYAFLYIKSNQENTNQARGRITRGQAAMLDRDMYKAMYEYTMALKYDPDIKGAHAALGKIAVINGQGDDAARHFLAEVQIDPRDRESRLALGCLYAWGCVPADDPNQVKGYLLDQFRELLPFEWPSDFAFTPDPEIDSLTEAIFHFQYALEILPGDPVPEIGLALTDIAVDNMNESRERLSKLTNFVQDESILSVIKSIIEDINTEEQYRNLVGSRQVPSMAGIPTSPGSPTAPDGEETASAPDRPARDLSGAIEALPPITGNVPSQGGFGSRTFTPYDMGSAGQSGNNFGLEVRPQNLIPQPSVIPISRDIFLEESNERIKTTRISNMYESGDMGFRVGEKFTMPVTGVEVTVLEQTDNRIVLEERGLKFTFAKGAVGWYFVPEGAENLVNDSGTIEGIPKGITVHPTDDNEGEENNGTTPSDAELGPEVSGD